jgi:hypothetical protein
LTGEDTDRVVHEASDADPLPILRAAAALLIATALVALGLVPLTRGLVAWGRAGDAPRPPLAQDAGRLPPEPRLQTQPFADIQQLRRSERTLLDSYGWVDQKAGVVRIPIERAKELMLARGWPAAASSGAQPGRP